MLESLWRCRHSAPPVDAPKQFTKHTQALHQINTEEKREIGGGEHLYHEYTNLSFYSISVQAAQSLRFIRNLGEALSSQRV